MADSSAPNPLALFDLAGRVAVITGASSGLGRRAAIALAAAGALVVGVARREVALADMARAAGPAAAFVVGDVADRARLPALVSAISAPFGAPDIVVHAAGVNTRQVADDVTPEAWDATLALNLTAPFFLSQALVPAMRERGWGRIVNFASLQTTRAFPAGIAYGASKAGIGQMTRAMAEAWSGYGITANAIGPGFFPTELTAAVFDDPARAARNAAQTCAGRNGRMEDMDGPLLFLCSDASAYVTGQILMVDGGFTAK
ncbi:SDR family NAD(P)-dependent oxidoreductase [Sulfitobacter guttiformis]|uniref:Gluconate 5-dehydrogenase n=1 Tax=Sulfitobacter guttiformis TaxID=74349 RepID=A0A420DNK1_9RHOB|nr:SDR family oxidoreductase [Sulfitobacter guttiformis]KIN73110.1 Gluconate 5-dehydrogenase [Sulfitobacter guttiformis KCTC 32187]RKE95795.1 gluconate 5-dehydrogenase [Sulfitobacter guttiformis]